jgi:thymidine kinase
MMSNEYSRKIDEHFKRTGIPFVINISGNIGSGKSSFLNHFESLKSTYIVPEPLHLMRDYEGRNILDLFYKKEIGVEDFQEIMIRLMLDYCNSEYKFACKKGYRCIVYDRSLFDTIETFCRMLIPGKYKEYTKQYSRICYKVNLFVFLECSPEYCYYRVKKRKRVEEVDVSLKYLKRCGDALNEFHNMISEKKRIRISSSQPTFKMFREVVEMLGKK